jgi:hypothetical protein
MAVPYEARSTTLLCSYEEHERAKYGARGGTRTPTPVKELDPKSSASTNFATRAHKVISKEIYIF